MQKQDQDQGKGQVSDLEVWRVRRTFQVTKRQIMEKLDALEAEIARLAPPEQSQRPHWADLENFKDKSKQPRR